MTKTNKILLITVLVLLVGAIGALVYLNYHQRNEMQELVEIIEIEKEELQEEYENLAIEFDGYSQMDIQNDSLQDLLCREQQRVQDLLEELRITKVTNARRISELKKELATVRTVLKDYIRQVDSLNATNARLTEENIIVRAENEQVKTQNTQLTNLNTQLTETVTRAAMLELTDCTCTMLNKNDRKTRMVSQVTKLQFDYTIAKNITCERGLKDLYVRVITPNGVLMNEAENKRFPFESDSIAYSITQQFEYSGEQYMGTVYLPITEEVEKGFYTIDFFCEGNLIGSFPIQIRK
jgi:predicted  nucleic acid-binding Zn-ribbon protein